MDDPRPPFPWPLLRFWLRRLLLMWFLIGLMIFLVQIAICGIVHDNARLHALLQYFESLPPFMLRIFGGDELGSLNAETFIAFGYEHPLVLILYMVFAVAAPSGMLTGESQGGTMELILSRSATKRQVYVIAGGLTLAGLFALTQVMFLGTVIGTRIIPFDHPVALYPFWLVATNGCLLAGVTGALALLSAATFQRRNMAVGVTVGYLVIDYFIWVVADWWPRMAFLAPFSLFHYVDTFGLIRKPLWPLAHMSVLAAIMCAALVAGEVVWRRRDLSQ